MRQYAGQTLSWTTEAGVIEVHLHRDPCNEIGEQTLGELERLAAFVAAGADGARALIWTSDQPAGFCAGADLRALREGMREHPAFRVGQRAAELPGPLGRVARRAGRVVSDRALTRAVRGFLTRIHAAFDTFDAAPLTTIAATHGVVFGGGFELALTADLIVADATSRFAFPELRLGLVPGFGGIPRLERDLGNAMVRDLLLTGRTLGAKRALEVGLVSQAVAAGKALPIARKVAAQAARFDAETVVRAKRFLKPIPRARLDEEIDTFCALVARPAVLGALDRFATSQDVRPYLP